MKVKVSTAVGEALDWMVKTAAGFSFDGKIWSDGRGYYYLHSYSPSTHWAQGGPIIEREIDQIDRVNDYPNWEANRFATDEYENCVGHGPTPLIAAMRCYVASKLGEEVEVPDDLV